MSLDKDIEILELNIKEAGKTMPPDVLHALKMGAEALKAIEVDRNLGMPWAINQLPGETPTEPPLVPEEFTQKIRESPLGKEPAE